MAVFSYTLPTNIVEELAELLRAYCPDTPLITIANHRWTDRRISPTEIVLAEDGVTGDLRPVNERRLIEAILVVKIRDDEIAALTHFASCFREPRLVAIDERDEPGPGNVQKQGAEEDEDEIADCGWQGGDSKIARSERQTGISTRALDVASRRGGRCCLGKLFPG